MSNPQKKLYNNFMSGKLIATIYFYLISAASLALIIIGVFNAVNYVINTTQYEKYPLRYQREDCEFYPYSKDIYAPAPPPAGGSFMASPSAEESEKLKKICLEQVDYQRKQEKLDDLKNAITFTLIGAILFGIHFPLARKQSKN
jgi:hypothetical protein